MIMQAKRSQDQTLGLSSHRHNMRMNICLPLSASGTRELELAE